MSISTIPDDAELQKYRRSIDDINLKLLELLNERGRIALKIADRKQSLGCPTLDPARESHILEDIVSNNKGPFSDETVKSLFKEILNASRELMDQTRRRDMLFSRRYRNQNTIVEVNGIPIGGEQMAIIAGPCSVESEEQFETIACALPDLGIKIMRGGTFKPRTSPYSFQGLGLEGVKIMRRVADRYGLSIVTEILEPSQVRQVYPYVDMLQIGCRNMYNSPLLREVGRCRKPVVLKRHFGATMEELLLAAEYILAEGNNQVILCERGIRTFEPWTRSTLDISAIPILQRETHLPIMVDISHPAGRRDILPALAKATKAVGARALMVEVHCDPANAMSDNRQQLDIEGLRSLINGIE